MKIKLMLITNNSNIATIAQDSGIDWIFVDLEKYEKENRQKDMSTVMSQHTIDDVKNLRKLLKKSELLVRINKINENSEYEINSVIKNGADIIMLPYFKSIEEVSFFLDTVNGRAKTCLLLETAEAVEILDNIVDRKNIDYIHIGLNDLHISYKLSHMFELLSNGIVEKVCKKISGSNIVYGFGGIAKLGYGELSSELILTEHKRLGSSLVILSRSFFDYSKNNLNDQEIRNYFKSEVKKIRNYCSNLNTKSNDFFKQNQKLIKLKIESILSKSIKVN